MGTSLSKQGSDYERTNTGDTGDALFDKAERILFPNERRGEQIERISTEQGEIGNTAPYDEPPSQDLLTRLSSELLENILNRLDNREIKSLRLSCRLFAIVAVLRINRVFLSANPLNIQVFRAIADHEVLRQGVVEIIYDDARLTRSAYDAAKARDPYISDPIYVHLPTDMDWFKEEREENLGDLKIRKSKEVDRPDRIARKRQADAEMPLQASWIYYQSLVRQQDEVIASDADVEALRYGLRRFPALRRVTITPAAHGRLFAPLYETPMIRAFPYGFNYPIPHGWPTRRPEDYSLEAASWEEVRARWRGCDVAIRVLAEERQHHHVSKLLIDSHQLNTGLNCRLFEQPCDAYTNLTSILREPGFRRFHLSLHTDGQEREDVNWLAFSSGLLRDALSEAMGLEHFSLATSLSPDALSDGVDPPLLQTILPIDRWPQLQHFGLWNFSVQQADLVSLLSLLPPTLRSLELSFLTFTNGNYRSLLSEMRSTLGWQNRHVRPSVTIATPVFRHRVPGRAIWLEKEIENFLYGDGENPFDGWPGPNAVGHGIGTVRDAFEPAYERPWVNYSEYQRLGYYKKSG